MVQLKTLLMEDLDGLEEALGMIEKGKGPFARTGTALATLKPKQAEIAVDDCDPCADEVDNDNEITDVVRMVLEKDPLVHATQLRAGTAAGPVL